MLSPKEIHQDFEDKLKEKEVMESILKDNIKKTEL